MIEEILKKVIKEFVDIKDVHLERPADISHGDFSTNVALVVSKNEGKNPHDFASELVENIKKKNIEEIEKIEVAGPGFINFYLKDKFFIDGLKDVLERGEKYGRNETNKGKKIVFEYIDPNPFKEIHIGHLMPATIGESLARLNEFSGAEVKRANYQGDVGMHVAKAIWAIMQSEARDDSPQYLGQSYARGSSAYETSSGAKEEINELNKKIYDRSDDEVNKIYDWGRKISLDYFETVYSRLDTKFDMYFFESEAGPIGKELVLEWSKKGLFEESDGAYVYKGEKEGLHTRVFLNSEGLPTYEAKELGLSGMKYEKFKYDLSYIITGNEINEYFKVLLKVMESTNPLLADKTTHIGHGMLRLSEGKMSSRTGDVITAVSLLDDVKKNALEKMSEKSDDIADQISLSAIKYSILKQGIGKDIIYDINKSLSFEGDSGPYIQYTAVRANSILEKSDENLELSKEGVGQLEKMLVRFPDVVKRAEAEFAPQHIVTYVTEVSSLFNSYYSANKIGDNPHRLAITKATSIILKNGLYLLGVSVPTRM